MRRPRVGLLAVLGALASLPGALAPEPGGQDGARRPSPPADAAPLPVVPEPPRSEVERRDLWQRFVPASPIAGHYRLRRMVRGGTSLGGRDEVQGYLSLGHRHLSLHLQVESATPGRPWLQSSFRTYRLDGAQMVTTTLTGFRNDADGGIQLEARGLTEVRTWQIVGGYLHIGQSPADFLEFERIE